MSHDTTVPDKKRIETIFDLISRLDPVGVGGNFRHLLVRVEHRQQLPAPVEAV